MTMSGVSPIECWTRQWLSCRLVNDMHAPLIAAKANVSAANVKRAPVASSRTTRWGFSNRMLDTTIALMDGRPRGPFVAAKANVSGANVKRALRARGRSHNDRGLLEPHAGH